MDQEITKIMITNKNKSTFCPAKWQEVVINPAQGYVNSCSKSPGYTLGEVEQQRINLNNGIKDSSCDYCWKAEANNKTSLRHSKINEWDGTLDLKVLDIDIGSLCNFQCAYCDPRSSTQWQADIANHGHYNVLFDADRINTTTRPDTDIKIDELLDYTNEVKSGGCINILGGEPLINPEMIKLLDRINVKDVTIAVPTNLCYKNNKIVEKLAGLCQDNEVWLKPSMDTVNENVKSYIRQGFDQVLFRKNVMWVLENTKINLEFLSLISAYTIWDLNETHEYVNALMVLYPGRIKWCPEYLHTPVNQSFDILTHNECTRLLLRLTHGIPIAPRSKKFNVIISALENSKFDYLKRKDQQNFFKQFNERHNIQTPKELEFLIEDEVE